MKAAGKSREAVSSKAFAVRGERDARHAAGRTPALPLKGLRVIVGRARHQASALSSGLRDLGAAVLDIPFIEIRRPRSYKVLDTALLSLSHYDWLILTSVNGVEALWERLRNLGLNRNNLGHLNIAAIGPATKDAIERHGLKVNVIPKEYVAESVVASLRQKVKGKRVLLARAKVARDVIPRELRKLGAQVDVAEAYETVVPVASREHLHAALISAKNRPHLITFTSSSTVKNFVALLGKGRGRGRPRLKRQLKGVSLASIGPVTSSTLRGLGLRVDIEAGRYNIPGLIKAIVVHQTKLL
jgi:uroporphyrinogen-III synthase